MTGMVGSVNKKPSVKKAPGIPIRIKGDQLGAPIGRLYISHRQMFLEFPMGVTRQVVLDLFPAAEMIVDEAVEGGGAVLIHRARIVSFWWEPRK